MILNIGIIGMGTVGRGIIEIIQLKKLFLKQSQDLDIRIVAVSDRKCGMAYNPEGLDLNSLIRYSEQKRKYEMDSIDIDVFDLIRDPNIDVWCELTNTNLQTAYPAKEYIRQALVARKHVVTTNKGPASLHLHELNQLAESKGVRLFIEGTILAGTPVINLLTGPLAGCEILKIEGILNGTTNFILTEMEQGKNFSEALEMAQSLGYAEADPTGDIEGLDAKAKVRILSDIIFKRPSIPVEIECKGIRDITKSDIVRAKTLNKCLKLIATIEFDNGKLISSVKPKMLHQSHPLAGVNGNMNAITFTTDLLGEVTIIGPGAGKKETGFAVINDLIHLNNLMKTKSELVY